jgi:hypothetical protein
VRGKAVRPLPVRSSLPSTSSLPEVGMTTPEMALKKVVLPAPFGPMMPTSSPACSVALTRRRP